MTENIVVDTDAFSVIYRKGQAFAAYSACLSGNIPVLSFATVAEVRFGAAKKGWGQDRSVRWKRLCGAM